MRYIIYVIVIYLVYLGLKTLLKQFLSPRKTGTPDINQKTSSNRRSKINPDEIEDAEYEEIKKP